MSFSMTCWKMSTFRLFVFSVVGKWPDAPSAMTARISAAQQPFGLLEGIRPRDSRLARQAYVGHTVRY